MEPCFRRNLQLLHKQTKRSGNQRQNFGAGIKYFFNNVRQTKHIHFFLQMIGDRFFVVDTETAVRIQSKRSKSNVYYYRFQYATVGGQGNIFNYFSLYQN